MKLAGTKTLVLGGETGLLGQALVDALTEAKAAVTTASRKDADLTDAEALARLLDRTKPEVIFNAVAHTQVDKAEDEPKAAREFNHSLPAALARLCAERGLFLVHYSTDFVFDGKNEKPYIETDPTGPLSVYGKTKLAGEQAVLGQNGLQALVIRTAWLFGPGRMNFVRKMLQLATERDTLSVVHDQTGSPTYAPDLAKHTLDLLEADATGLFHLVNSGEASWCELAGEAVNAAGLACRVEPIPTSAYPTRATRPAHSVLDTTKFTEATGKIPRPWIRAVRDYVYLELEQEEAD